VSGPPVPPDLRTAAAWAWRLAVIAVVVVLAVRALADVRVVVVPLLVALLLATQLDPAAQRLRAAGAGRALAALVVVGGAGAFLAGVLALLAPAVAGELDDLGESVSEGIERVTRWAADAGLGVDPEAGAGDLVGALRDNAQTLGGGAVAGAMVAVEILAGLALLVVFTFFLVKDGDEMWRWLVARLAAGSRAGAEELGRRVWRTLGLYVRGLVVVAAFDAVFIALALWAIGVPLVIPLAVLTFLAAFIPVLGAWLAGAACALVALVALGPREALLVIAATIVVQQVESNVLHPVVMGRALALHPMLVLGVVAVGGILGGVLGAALAPPIAAAVVTTGSFLRERRQEAEDATPGRELEEAAS
jgi:predicted PurR-regulated permease PerM